MKTLLKGSMAFLIATFLITSCQKSLPEPMSNNDANIKAGMASVFAGEDGNARLIQVVEAYYEATGQEFTHSRNGSTFVPPLFNSEGFGIIKDLVIDFSGPFPIISSGQLAGFTAEYDNNDFWRENPDGTISVHLTSNKAAAEHFDFETGVLLEGDKGNMTMKYTGDLVTIVLPFGTFYFIDTSNSPNATVWHGNGKVKENGTGPQWNLVAHLTAGPSQQASVWFTLN